ncbi:MAG: phosphoribosylaminoimidazolesuccinocarboxamide synthase [Oscillospiraceae bacterium]|jgi:phosphoribosylaminoimidazole-succinocarboxamide synthase|nr:phosphoribosylaminoimidazolesuccinocarboxamide synthase [Oscillospiraceae bacterium]
MKKLITGKTKDVYQLDDGNYKLIFKDDMTGTNGVFDPGANTVGLTVEGAGRAGLVMSVYYFEMLKEKGYPTHFISADISTETSATTKENSMTVKLATQFGKGLEVICRYKALGSFIRRYGGVIKEGTPLNAVVEMTLKDDKREDPFINKDALEAIGILEPGEYEKIKSLTQEICSIIKTDLASRDLELCDIKLEFGKDKNGEIILTDEISGGNMRVIKNGKTITPLELSTLILKS